jgi:hypothetical protein
MLVEVLIVGADLDGVRIVHPRYRVDDVDRVIAPPLRSASADAGEARNGDRRKAAVNASGRLNTVVAAPRDAELLDDVAEAIVLIGAEPGIPVVPQANLVMSWGLKMWVSRMVACCERCLSSVLKQAPRWE